MQRTLLSSKIHRATVTDADLHYVGSLTIDRTLMDAAGPVENEQVQVVDITNGARLVTYVIEVAAGELAEHRPRVVHADAQNQIIEVDADPAAPVPGATEQGSWRRVRHRPRRDRGSAY